MGKKRSVDVSDIQIVEAYQRLRSASGVHRELGVANTTIYRALERANIERDGLHEWRDRVRKCPKRAATPKKLVPYESILELSSQGLTQMEIVRRLGVSQSTVSRAERMRGFNRETPRAEKHSSWNGGRYLKEGYWLIRLDPNDPLIEAMANRS